MSPKGISKGLYGHRMSGKEQDTDLGVQTLLKHLLKGLRA